MYGRKGLENTEACFFFKACALAQVKYIAWEYGRLKTYQDGLIQGKAVKPEGKGWKFKDQEDFWNALESRESYRNYRQNAGYGMKAGKDGTKAGGWGDGKWDFCSSDLDRLRTMISESEDREAKDPMYDELPEWLRLVQADRETGGSTSQKKGL